MDVEARAREAARRHLGGAAGLRPLAGGLDHQAFLVGGVVVRVARQEGDAAREAALLALVRGRVPLAVPEPVFADDDLGVLGYHHLPGTTLLGREAPDGAAAALGAFLTALHTTDTTDAAGAAPEEDADPAAWLDDLTGPEHHLAHLRATVPDPGTERRLTHADLGAEHLLVDGGRLTGVIDWTDAAVTDPALDFARLLRDFGQGFLDDVLAAYALEPPAATRILFFARCAALEDLAYGGGTGRTAYGIAARAAIRRLF